MLRLFKLLLAGAGAAALLATAANAQAGLGSRLDAQERQLAQAENSCGPVNLAEYANLLNEATQNKARAEKMKKKGVPVDETQVNADLAKAMQLFARAQAAQARNCMLQAQQQAQQPQAPKVSLNPFQQGILDAHNAERAAVGVPPLQWNAELAQHATEYAQVMAQTGQLVHAPRDGRGTERENLQKGLVGWSPERMFQDWAKEKANFSPGDFPNVARDGNWMNVAHYTQIIWPTTTEIGCGTAQGGGFVWLDCRYNPGGNKDGKPVGFAQATPPATWQAGTINVTVLPVNFAPQTPQAATVVSVPLNTAIAPPPPAGGRRSAWYVGGEFGATIVEDIGLDSGGNTGSSVNPLVLNHDYSYDGSLFVGYDLGAFRIEAEAAYKRADIDRVPGMVLPGAGGNLVSQLYTLGEAQYLDALNQLAASQYPAYLQGIRNNALVDNSALADQLDMPVIVKSVAPLTVVTSVDQPALPTQEAFNSENPKLQPGKPSYANPSYLDWCKNVVFDDQARLFESARKARDPAGMQAAQAQMEVAIAQKRRYLSDVTEAGEMAAADRRQVQQDLDRSIDLYKAYTGEDPRGGPPAKAESCPTEVSQPQLPAGEVFTPPQQPPPTPIEPM
jgi:uncharacterized protein YkwD